MRLFKCGALTTTPEYPYRDRCPARPHTHCGSGWCAQHHDAKCGGKCVDPNPPVQPSADEMSRTDAAAFVERFRRVDRSFLMLSIGLLISTLCLSGGVVSLSLRPSEASNSILRWSTPSALGDKTCSLLAPPGAAGLMLCCREDSYSASGATCDITAEPAWFEPKDLRRSWADRDAPGPALSFGSGEKPSTHKFWVADPYALPLYVDAGVSGVTYDRSRTVWQDIRVDMNRLGGAVEVDAGPVERTDTGTILGILKKASFDDGGTDWMHSGYYLPSEIDAGPSTTTTARTGTFFVDPGAPHLTFQCTAWP